MITPTKDFWNVFKNTEGALSCCEALAIMNIAALAPQGLCIELGSHKGKSGMSAIVSLKSRSTFFLIDPIYEDAGLQNSVFETVFWWGDFITVRAINGYSTDIIPKHNDYAYVFVDSGSHQDGLPMQEVKLLEDRVVPGGIIAFHDFKSQFVEVEGAYNYLLKTGEYEYVPINWVEIVEYVRANDLERDNKSWHHNELEFPCFVGALKRK